MPVSPAWVITTLLVLMTLGLGLWGCGRTQSGPAQVPVETLSATPQSIIAGEEVLVTGTVVNALSSPATYPVRLLVNGALVQTTEVTVQPRAQEVVTFRYTPPSPGKYQFRLGDLTAEVTVLRPSTYFVSCLVVRPESARVGEPITVEAAVSNSGDVGGVFPTTFTVNNESIGTKDLVFQSGREQEVVSFQYTPQVTGAGTVSVGSASGSFTALPSDGSLLPPPKGLGDIRVIYATGIADSATGGFQHIHGLAYDPQKNTMWVSDFELEQDLFEVDALACNNARVKPIVRRHVLLTGEERTIEDIALDREDGTFYYIERAAGKLSQIDSAGKLLRELDLHMTIQQGEAVLTLDSFYSLFVQGDFLWLGTEALLVQLDKANWTPTGNLVGAAGTGAAYDPDRDLIWSSDWLDCRFEAFDPVGGARVFQSEVVTLPVPDPTQCHRGHNLAYGDSRLWVGTENFEEDFIYGIRVK